MDATRRQKQFLFSDAPNNLLKDQLRLENGHQNSSEIKVAEYSFSHIKMWER